MNVTQLDQQYLKKLKVLYVEDDDDTREQFSEFLYRPVGTLYTAANGAIGLEMFNKHLPDIVVTDILMPVMDGLSMAHEIRGIAPAVPIIVITAFENNDYLRRAIDIGVDKYVTKPVNSYLLFESLLECAHLLRAEEQLHLAHQRKIEAMRMKHQEVIARLAGGLAHDYNALLHSILGQVFLATLEMDPKSKSWEHLQKINTCYEQAHSLNQLLYILTGQTDEYELKRDVLPSIRRALEQTLDGTGISLELDCPAFLPDIKYIDRHIFFVFEGLGVNAVEAMPSGGTLRLSAEKADLPEGSSLPLVPGGYLHISLSDTGAGIDPESLKNIFDPYFTSKQAHNQRGVGLNLALCHTIIMNHGGTITAESTPGQGTTFHIWLPVAEETAG